MNWVDEAMDLPIKQRNEQDKDNGQKSKCHTILYIELLQDKNPKNKAGKSCTDQQDKNPP